MSQDKEDTDLTDRIDNKMELPKENVSLALYSQLRDAVFASGHSCCRPIH
jgi:hypothetical protein